MKHLIPSTPFGYSGGVGSKFLVGCGKGLLAAIYILIN